MSDPITNLSQLVHAILAKLKNLITSGRWFSLFIFLLVVIYLAFAPFQGWFYPSIATFITDTKQYVAIFWMLLFSLVAIYIFWQIFLLFIRATRPIKFFLIGLFGLLIFLTASVFVAQARYLPDGIDKYLSYGVESLFFEGSPEEKIYQRNQDAMQQDKDPFIIAVSVPISRPNGSYYSDEILTGVAIAQEEWNRDNEDLQAIIAIADDGYWKRDAHETTTHIEKAKDAAEKIASLLVKEEAILAVIGHAGSDATQSAAKIYKDKLVAVSPVSTAIRKNDNSCDEESICLNDYVFRTSIDDLKASELLVNEIIERNNSLLDAEKIEKIAIVFDSNSVYSNSFKSSFKKRFQHHFGEEDDNENSRILINEEKCDLAKANYKDSCFDSIKENVDAILFIPGETETASQVEDIIAKNYDLGDKRLFLLGSDTMYQENFVSINGKPRNDTKGMLIPLTWHRSNLENCDSDQNKLELECKATKIFPNKEATGTNPPLAINWRVATAYESAKVIFEGLKFTKKEFCSGISNLMSSKKQNCLRSNLKDALESDDFKQLKIGGAKVGTSITFENGERYFSSGLGVVVEAKNGSFSEFKANDTP